jgi:hypothetical protein
MSPRHERQDEEPNVIARRPALAALARQLAQALEEHDARDEDLGVARGLAWTLADVLGSAAP